MGEARLGFLNTTDPDAREVLIDGGWWTSPDNVKQKMDALLDPRKTVLAGGRVARGVGFWEIGHEDLAKPELTDAIKAWRAGDRSLGGIDPSSPGNTRVLIDSGANWRYLDTGVYPGATWMARTFNDGTWRRGLAQFGYGDGDEATLVGYGTNVSSKYITTWFRHAFTLASTSNVRALTLRLLRDDGAVVYLNGTEVFRRNLAAGAITSPTTALAALGGVDETNWFRTNIGGGLLQPGTNLLAVEVHQASTNSSDLSFDLELTATLRPELTITATTTNYLLRWPASAPGFRVQSTNVLNGAAIWPTLTATGRVSGAFYEMPITQPPPRFFRLIAP